MVRLGVGQVEDDLQLFACLSGLVRLTDDLDDLVNVEDRHEQALHQVQAVGALAQAEFGAAADHVQAVVNVHAHQVEQAEGLRLTVHERHVVNAEGILKRSVLVEGGEHRLRVEAVLDFDDEAQTVGAVGQVDHVGDAGELLGVDAVLDLFDDLFGADHVRQFGDDNALLAGADLLDGDLRAGLEGAAAGFVGVTDASQTHDGAAGGQVGAGDELHDVFEGRLGVGDEVAGTGDDLAQVVRRHVGCHADRDAGGAVDEQVRERCGQHGGLHELVVVVRHEVNHVFFEVRGECLRGGCHACFGVSGGCRAVVEGAEVTVTVNEGQAQREGLGEAHHRVVDGGVAVRVELTHDLAGHAGALDMALIGAQTHLLHHVEDAALHGLEAVAGVGEGARINHRVGVFQEAGFHLGGYVDVDDILYHIHRVVADGGFGSASHISPRVGVFSLLLF